MHFFEKGKTTIENEDWVEFLWTTDNLNTFLTIMIIICIIGGWIIFRYVT